MFIYFMFRPGWRGITRLRAFIYFVILFFLCGFLGVATQTPEQKAALEQKKQIEQAKEQQKKDVEAQKQAEKNKEAEKQKFIQDKSNEIKDKLKVKVEVQDQMDSKDNNKVVIWFRNESDYKVSADVRVVLKDAAKNNVDSDIAMFKNIEAQKGGFAIAWLKAKRVTSYEWSINIKDITPQ